MRALNIMVIVKFVMAVNRKNTSALIHKDAIRVGLTLSPLE